MPWDRVHSRIPDRRQLDDVATNQPASFMAFKQHQSSDSVGSADGDDDDVITSSATEVMALSGGGGDAVDWEHVPQRAGRSETVALPRGHLPRGHRPAAGPPALSYSKHSAQSIQPRTARGIYTLSHSLTLSLSKSAGMRLHGRNLENVGTTGFESAFSENPSFETWR